MATQFKHHAFDPISDTTKIARPRLALVQDVSNYADLERHVAGVAARGVHPRVLGIFVGCYATMLLSFWAMFARDAATALVLAVVTVLMILYFSLIIGGIALADSPVVGERQRSFDAFLRGPVDIATGIISGREAAIQMLFLPGCMVVLATTIGIIARVSQLS